MQLKLKGAISSSMNNEVTFLASSWFEITKKSTFRYVHTNEDNKRSDMLENEQLYLYPVHDNASLILLHS